MLQLTRPDGSPVSINTREILTVSPVPNGGPGAGPPAARTRILFRNGAHQDVTEDHAEVTRRWAATADGNDYAALVGGPGSPWMTRLAGYPPRPGAGTSDVPDDAGSPMSSMEASLEGYPSHPGVIDPLSHTNYSLKGHPDYPRVTDPQDQSK